LPPIPQPKGWNEKFGMKLETASQALLQARAKPLTDLQKKILIGAARRVGLPVTSLLEASQLKTSLEADAYLMKAEAELVAKKV